MMLKTTSLTAMQGRRLLVVLSAIATCLATVQARNPPIVRSYVPDIQAVRAGETIKLPCPVLSDDPPILQWSKDGDTIHGGWERYKLKSDGLQIKDVSAEDEGDYICTATNGFGQVEVSFYLQVISCFLKTSPMTRDHKVNRNGTDSLDYEDGTPAGRTGMLPEFSEPESMQRKPVLQKAGSTVRLKCKAHGKPKPNIIWFKDGKVLRGAGRKRRHWTLQLRDVRKEDSGRYTCKVYNRAGAINFTYSVEIVEQIKEKPVVLSPHPENQTVEYGSRAAFQCRVQSEDQPHIKWLKLIEGTEHNHNKNATISVNGQSFVVLQMGKVLKSNDGSYLNKLIIEDVRERDAGMYICLGANGMGYSAQPVYLTVLPGKHKYPDYDDYKAPSGLESLFLTPIPIIIGVLVGFVIIIVAVIIYCLKCRRPVSGKQKPPVMRQVRPPPVVPPQEKHTHFEQQYTPLQSPYHHMMVGAPSRERIVKPHSDMYSDVSLPHHLITPPPPPPSQQIHYDYHVHHGSC